jgi:dTDP-4-dehydrorhamnose reductase
MKKILVTGAAGMLGTAILDNLRDRYKVIATDITRGYNPPGVPWKELDLLDNRSATALIEDVKPDAVIHCAALVNVDACEKQPALAEAVHMQTTATLAAAIAKYSGKLVYISTDSVFNGTKNRPYDEDDPVDPPNIYAMTKFKGEQETLRYANNTVLRTNIFGWSRAEKISFAEWVIKSLVTSDKTSMFTDVTYTPIHVTHLSKIIAQVIEKNVCGLLHAGGASAISKYEFGTRLATIFNLPQQNISPSRIDDAGLGAKRPKNMALSSLKLKTVYGISVPEADEGISLLKNQYDKGWVAQIKGRPTAPDYRFWEV